MSIVKLNTEKIATIFGILATLAAGGSWAYAYEKNLVKKSDLAVMDLDARIERTEILIAVYSRNVESLSQKEKDDYERAKARLINLEEQRDRLLGL